MAETWYLATPKTGVRRNWTFPCLRMCQLIRPSVRSLAETNREETRKPSKDIIRMARLITVGNTHREEVEECKAVSLSNHSIEQNRTRKTLFWEHRVWEKSNQRKRGKPPTNHHAKKRSRELSTVLQANNTCKRRWPEREKKKKKSEHTISVAAAVVGFCLFRLDRREREEKRVGRKKRAAEKVACIADDRRRYIYTWCAPYKDKYHALAFKKIQTDCLFFFFFIFEHFLKIYWLARIFEWIDSNSPIAAAPKTMANF